MSADFLVLLVDWLSSMIYPDTLPVSVLEVPITHLDRRVGLCLGSTDEVGVVSRRTNVVVVIDLFNFSIYWFVILYTFGYRYFDPLSVLTVHSVSII